MDQPKFSLVEIILGTLFSILIDILAAIADFFTIGILGFFIQALTWLVFTFWFTIKGVKATASLAKRFIIPIAVQIVPLIPTLAATFLVTTYLENHPEKLGALQQKTKKIIPKKS